jgi:hypothetical protein
MPQVCLRCHEDGSIVVMTVETYLILIPICYMLGRATDCEGS